MRCNTYGCELSGVRHVVKRIPSQRTHLGDVSNVVQAMWCNMCGPIHGVRDMSCNLRSAIHTVRSMCCTLCSAIAVAQAMQQTLCGEVYVVQACAVQAMLLETTP
eukprot:422930-Pyramimonas_sp.AAC.1